MDMQKWQFTSSFFTVSFFHLFELRCLACCYGLCVGWTSSTHFMSYIRVTPSLQSTLLPHWLLVWPWWGYNVTKLYKKLMYEQMNCFWQEKPFFIFFSKLPPQILVKYKLFMRTDLKSLLLMFNLYSKTILLLISNRKVKFIQTQQQF